MRRSSLALLTVALTAVLFGAPPAVADDDSPSPTKPLTMAVIGDTPYGPEQLVAFPNLVGHINADRQVGQVLHLGDIKSGSTVCSDEYFARIRTEFDSFADPVIYTPGDNEWTDCHRPTTGDYDPHERLQAIRDVFFDRPGRLLGQRQKRVLSQAYDPRHRAIVENVVTADAGVVLGTLHVVGSNNGLAPWTNETPEQTERRLAEVSARTAAALDWIDTTFAAAKRLRARGVVIAMQADTFVDLSNSGFAEIVRRIADKSRAFPGQVLLLQGDTHRYKTDIPLASGHPGYGITEPVPNLTRIVVEGETASEWLKLTINPRAQDLFTWTRVQVP